MKKLIIFVLVMLLFSNELLPKEREIDCISPEELQSILSNVESKIVVVWGFWCSGQQRGLNKLNVLADKIEILLFATDICDESSKAKIQNYIDSINLKSSCYIITNNYEIAIDSTNLGNDIHSNMVHKTNTFMSILSGDSLAYSIPYISLLDKENSVIYSSHPQVIMDSILKESSKDALSEEELNSVLNNFFENEVKKIESIIKN